MSDVVRWFVLPGVIAAVTGVALVALLRSGRRGGPHGDTRLERTAGALLVAGFAVFIPGVAFAVSSQTGTDYIPPTFSTRAGAVLLLATLSLTLMGLLVFDAILWRRGDRSLSTVGTAAYLAAVIAWAAATERALVVHEWTYRLEAAFIVASGISMLAFGSAVIRTGAIARWLGWVAVCWSIGSLIRFAMPHQVYPPMVAQLVPLVFGFALLRVAARDRSSGRRQNAMGRTVVRGRVG